MATTLVGMKLPAVRNWVQSPPHVRSLPVDNPHAFLNKIPPEFPIWMFIKFILAYSTPYLLVNITDLNSLSVFDESVC